MLDYSVDFVCRYGEGVRIGGGKISLQGEFRIDVFFKMADCMFISGKWSGFYPVDIGILRF